MPCGAFVCGTFASGPFARFIPLATRRESTSHKYPTSQFDASMYFNTCPIPRLSPITPIVIFFCESCARRMEGKATTAAAEAAMVPTN